MPFYVVRQGRKPGIYQTWDECKEQVLRFAGAEYKKFKTHSEAQEYLDDDVKIIKVIPIKVTQTKRKISSNIPEDLIKDTIKDLQKTLSISNETTTTTTIKIQREEKVVVQKSDEYRVAYSDGCCFGNGQLGSRAGFGVYWDDDHPWNVSERLRGDQTNNRAELTAAIRAMEIALNNEINQLEIRTDSKYTIQCATEWIAGWKRNNWIKKSDSKPVLNKDLMIRIDELQKQLKVKWTYVAGHSSNKGNDEADRLAKAGAAKS